MKKIKYLLKDIDWIKLSLPYLYCLVCGIAAVIIINGDWSFIPVNIRTYVLNWFRVVVIVTETITIIYETIIIILNIYKRLK